LVLATRGVEWRHAAELGEGGFGPETFGVVPGGDKEGRGLLAA
jgi:hypothetical protein